MKKLVFFSNMAFDANLSIIFYLRKYYDVYYFIEWRKDIPSRLHFPHINKLINCAHKLPEMKAFGRFLDLSKTYIILGCADRKIFQQLANSYTLYKYVQKINPDYILTDALNFLYVIPTLCFHHKTTLLLHDPLAHSGENQIRYRIKKRLNLKIASQYILFNQKQIIPFREFYHIYKKRISSTFLSIYEYLYLYDNIRISNNEIKQINTDSNFTYILFFGRISKYKGIEYLLRAYHELKEERQIENLKLIVAGGGNFDFDIERYRDDNIIIFNYFLPTEELVALIKKSIFVICPYVDATQSGVVMSSYTFLKPVIVTNVGGLPEMVADNQTGIIIPPKNVGALKNAILYLYSNPLVCKQMKDNIQSIYHNGNKCWSVAVKRIVDALEK